MRVLFVAWDGPQVSYLEGLFLPIFSALKTHGWLFHVLQFTWGDQERLKASKRACHACGIPYRCVHVWRRPVSAGAFASALNGHRYVRRASKDWHIDIVMPRSTLPALSTLLALPGDHSPTLVFDADGLALDERVDFAGMDASGANYRLLRDVESQAVRRSRAVLTRTEKAADILAARAGGSELPSKFHVVTNGRNAAHFAPPKRSVRRALRQELGIDVDAPVLVYAGSVGEQYCFGAMLDFFSSLRSQRPDAHLLILTASINAASEALALKLGQDAGISRSGVTLRSVSYDDMPSYLAMSDLGLALRQPAFSMQGVAPIKIGEYLLCGLPVLATRAIGNTSCVDTTTGYLTEDNGTGGWANAVEWFLKKVLPNRNAYRTSCRALGVKHFSLEASVDTYARALKSVAT